MLKDSLLREKETVFKKWFELVVSNYPGETQKVLLSNTDRFANPVRASLAEGLEGLLQNLIDQSDLNQPIIQEHLDKIIRIRAVQDFSPSSAVGFVFLLKYTVREVLAKEITDSKRFEELLTFETSVDKLALLAFNVYMQCREAVFNIRATEIRNRTSRILDRACQKYGMPHGWCDPDDDVTIVEQQDRGDGR
jgi:hypothetical protein